MIMSVDERRAALRNIARVIPSVVFDRFIQVLTTVKEPLDDVLVRALSDISTDPMRTFCYRMKKEEPEDAITPIREILDLCEGWFITSNSVVTLDERIKWEVHSIVGKEVM